VFKSAPLRTDSGAVSPAFLESLAQRLWTYHWALGVAALAAHAVLLGFLVLIQRPELRIVVPAIHVVFMLFVAAICWCWGLMMVGVSFHPDRGTARIGSPWFLRAPRVVQIALRWWTALGITLLLMIPFVLLATLVV